MQTLNMNHLEQRGRLLCSEISFQVHGKNAGQHVTPQNVILLAE